MLLGGLDGGVYVNAHWLFDNMHTFGLKIPPAPLSLHAMMPIMEEDGFEVSATDTVRVFVFPEVNVAGFAVTLVVVASSCTLADTCEVPVLLE